MFIRRFNMYISFIYWRRYLMRRELQVEMKIVFGRELIYPVCNDSKLICELLNVKTLNDYQIRKLTALDYRLAFNQEDYDFNCQH